MKNASVLLVDDEAYVRKSLAAVLSRRGFDVKTAASVDEALQASLLDGLDAVVTDLRMQGADGLQLLRKLKESEPDLPVVVLTAHGSVSSAVECLKAGASDFLQKPTDPEELTLVLRRAIENTQMRREWEYLRDVHASEKPGGVRPLGSSGPWRKVMELVEAVAPTDSSVLLQGESGTGKEVVANYIHQISRRRERSFVRVNCAAIPGELFESEFFGHRKGAFTGALTERQGRFRVADGGTLLLDEVASMPETLQAKVLRVLQDGEFERVGDSESTRVDVRILAATNSDLSEACESGEFRRDLFFRLNVVTISLPPLRERVEDIEELAEAFLKEFSVKVGKLVTGLAPETHQVFCRYSWPGNVRELRNVIERGVILEKQAKLRLESLPSNLFEGEAPAEDSDMSLRSRLAREEKRLLLQALEEAGGVRRAAARILGIDERNLSYYLKKHDLN